MPVLSLSKGRRFAGVGARSAQNLDLLQIQDFQQRRLPGRRFTGVGARSAQNLDLLRLQIQQLRQSDDAEATATEFWQYSGQGRGRAFPPRSIVV